MSPCHTMMLCANVVWKPSGSGGENFNFVNVFFLIRHWLPLERNVCLHLNKLEFPLPKNEWAKFGPVVHENKIFNVVNVCLLLGYHIPL